MAHAVLSPVSEETTMAEPRLRPCRTCGVPQPLDHYYPDPERADGLDSRCKDCFRQRSAANRARKRAWLQAG